MATAAIAAGAALLKIGADFDAAGDKIAIKTGATGDVLAGLQGDFKAVFSSVPTDMETASDAIAGLNQRLGLTGPALQESATQFINLARITGAELTPLIEGSTRTFAAWQIATQDQGAAMDFLFKTSQTTGVTVDALNAALVKSGPTLQAMGISFEESAALMGQWEMAGVNSEVMLAGLSKAQVKFANDGIPARQGLQDAIDKIFNLGEGSAATALAIDIFGAKAGPQVAAQIAKGNFAVGDLTASLKQNDSTINKTAASTDDWTQKLEVMKNKLLVAVAPAADAVFNGLGELIENVTPFVEQLAVWIGENLPGAMAQAKVWLDRLHPAFELLGTVLGFIGEHLLPLVGGAFDILGKTFDNMGNALSTLIGWLKNAWQWLQNLAQAARNMPVIGGIGDAIGNVGSFLGLAEGGSFIAREPTLAMFGEGGGPELVTATPLGRQLEHVPVEGPPSGLGSGAVISGNNFYIREEADIQRVAVELAALERRDARSHGLPTPASPW